jgi:hypothetical protein
MPQCVRKRDVTNRAKYLKEIALFSTMMKTTLGLVAAMGIASIAAAQEMALPTGDIILTVTGEIDVTNAESALVLDFDALAALDAETLETTTIWTEGLQSFQGVSLKTLTDLLGTKEGTLLATAINDYTVEIPVSDAVEGGPIIAYLMNDKEMSVRDKGPLWVIYPYDRNADYRSEVVYSRSIWKLDRIEVVK